VLIAGLKYDGTTYYTQHMGSTIAETPGDLAWNPTTKQINAFINTNSVSFNNQGGSDWLVFLLDYKGRNQCTALNLVDIASTLTFSDSSARFRDYTAQVSLTDISVISSSTITNVGVT
jgi:hypothetical protein